MVPGSLLHRVGSLSLRSIDYLVGVPGLSVVVLGRLSCSMSGGILAPRPGTDPVSPALQGGFLTTGPLGKSLSLVKLNLGTHRLVFKALKKLLTGKISKSTPILFFNKEEKWGVCVCVCFSITLEVDSRAKFRAQISRLPVD